MKKILKKIFIIYIPILFGILYTRQLLSIIIITRKINTIKTLKKKYHYYLDLLKYILENNTNPKFDNTHLVYAISNKGKITELKIGILYKELILSIFQLATIDYNQKIIIKKDKNIKKINKNIKKINKNIDKKISKLENIIKNRKYLSYFQILFDYIKESINEEKKSIKEIISFYIDPIPDLFFSEPPHIFFGLIPKYSDNVAADAHNKRIDFRKKYHINDERMF